MDVKTTFLNGELDEKNLYGSAKEFCSRWSRSQHVQVIEIFVCLKQAPEQCHEKFDQTFLLKIGCALIKQMKFWLEFDQT
jgi:hypothetical protein